MAYIVVVGQVCFTLNKNYIGKISIMSFLSLLTNETISETWSTSSKSDSWSTADADGGSIVRKLGALTAAGQQATVIYTSDGTSKQIHMGTWVTDVGSPEVINIPLDSSFGIHRICGYESAGQLNANVYLKVSVVTESGGVLTWDRTLIDWNVIRSGAVAAELGLSVGSGNTLGSASNTGITTYPRLTSAETIAIGERLAVEVGIATPGRNGDTVAIEFGDSPNHVDDFTLTAGAAGTGPFGSGLICPMNFALQANGDVWADHSEIAAPWVVGTDTIAWADIGTDWSTAKWVTTGAARYAVRFNGNVEAQFWVFQDDDFLYFATNNIIDGCIQPSDHHEIFICASSDWQDELTTDPLDWCFRRDIVAHVSSTTDPTLPVAQGDGNDQGNYILQGDNSLTYPITWEVPSYDAPTKTFTFSSNGKTFVEGTDYRMGGPGATSTAPNPGAGSSGAYSEFKIRKSKLNNWNGTTPIGIIIIFQCDVQADGTAAYPPYLSGRADKSDWPWSGIFYSTNDGLTASSKSTADEVDYRPLMSAHLHTDTPPTATRDFAATTAGSITSADVLLGQDFVRSPASVSLAIGEYIPQVFVTLATITEPGNTSLTLTVSTPVVLNNTVVSPNSASLATTLYTPEIHQIIYYPVESELSRTNLTGPITNIQEGNPLSPDTDWLTASAAGETLLYADFVTVDGNCKGQQKFAIVTRKTSGGDIGIPTVRIELWNNGALVRASSEINVTNTVSQYVEWTWDASEIAGNDYSEVEIKVFGTPGA